MACAACTSPPLAQALARPPLTAGTPARAGASPSPGAPSPAFSSPADFYGFPRAGPQEGASPRGAGGGAAGAATGATPAAPRSASVDGVPRDADGIPTLTPATVTVRRGSGGAGLGVVLEEDGDLLAANLFGDDDFGADGGSFSPLGDGARAFSPGFASPGADASPGAAFGSPAAADGQAAVVGAADAQAQQEQQQGDVAATPASAGADFSFSFFPSAAGQRPAADAAARVTPELAAAGGQGAGGSQISPEILGYYEQQAQQAQRAQADAATPVLPK